MSLASIIFFICNSKSFPYSSQPNFVLLKLETSLFQWFCHHFFQYFQRDGYQSNFLDETKQYRFEARKPTYKWMARVSFQSTMSTAISRKTHLVPGSLFVSLPVSQTVFSLIVLSVIVLLWLLCIYPLFFWPFAIVPRFWPRFLVFDPLLPLSPCHGIVDWLCRYWLR